LTLCKLAGERGEAGRSHRKLAHRGSRLQLVHASESTVLRVLTDAGLHLPGAPPREPRPARPRPERAELVPGVIWICDFAHLPGRSGAPSRSRASCPGTG